ncbi:uncharacterized protein LOC134210788 [Armigeres subalbatus]|uniref:uncharacterized protein LOC134210788 n=1 Tax=Armigeres subalbatus TaxID=124917 RepID=UPI002ED65119
MRYVAKISDINFTDPYTAYLTEKDFPTTVTAGHVVQYLLNHAASGGNHMKNTRSVEAYKKFESGFVHSVSGGIINDLHVVRGKVSHSMRLNNSPLTAWMIINRNGNVRSAHCNCVAGLSETCSHVSTLLYALANLHFMTSTYKLSVTELPSYWARPAKRLKDDLYHPVEQIDYGFKVVRHDDLNLTRTKAEFLSLVTSLQHDEKEPAILRKFCGTGYSCLQCRQNVVPDHILLNKRIILSNQFNPDLEFEDLSVIMQASKDVVLKISDSEIIEVEKLTRLQSRCDLWRWVRIGRVTASLLSRCIHSQETVPKKMSLLKDICHPYLNQKKSEAIRYGRDNEPKAKKALQAALKNHSGIRLVECGVFIDRHRPYLAATPDLIMECDCCGKVAIEIKCPFRLSNKSSFNNQFCIQNLEFITSAGDNITLNMKHPYYWQIQAQMFITNSVYGILCVWSESEVVCIRVEKDHEAWAVACQKSETYFMNKILPELLANYYSNQRSIA